MRKKGEIIKINKKASYSTSVLKKPFLCGKQMLIFFLVLINMIEIILFKQ